jgi:hypothetical protein
MPIKLKIHKPTTLRKKGVKGKKHHTQTNGSSSKRYRSSTSHTPYSMLDFMPLKSKSNTPYNILDFMPLKSKLVVDIIILAFSLEAHAKKFPEEDIYNIIKTNKTFNLFSKSIRRGFGEINERIFSYLFLAIILHTSSEMNFTFEGVSFIEHPVELTKYLKGMSTVVLEEIRTGKGADYDDILKHNTSVKSKSGKHSYHSRKIRVGGRKTYRNASYKQTGGEFDFILLFAFFTWLYARSRHADNPRFFRLSLPIMTLYWFYCVFSLYNNVRYLWRPNGIFEENMAPDFTGLIQQTSIILQEPSGSAVFNPLRAGLDELPSAIRSSLSSITDSLSVGTIATLIFGWFGYREGAADWIAPRLRVALTDFMTSPYYTALQRDIAAAASEIAARSSAAVATTRARPITSSGLFQNPFEAMRRGLHSLTGIDIAEIDRTLGDFLYNGYYSGQISREVFQSVMENVQIAIRRLGEDFTRILQSEITGFRTRLVRHGLASGFAVAGIYFSSLFFYRYYLYRRELRRPNGVVPQPPPGNDGQPQLPLLTNGPGSGSRSPPHNPKPTPEDIVKSMMRSGLDDESSAMRLQRRADVAQRLGFSPGLPAYAGRNGDVRGCAQGGRDDDNGSLPGPAALANEFGGLNLRDPEEIDNSVMDKLTRQVDNMGVSGKKNDRCESPK